MEIANASPAFQSDQWQAVGLALTALTTLLGSGLTIWGGIITRQHEIKIRETKISIQKMASLEKALEIYQDTLISAETSLSAFTFLGNANPRELELISRMQANIAQALEKGERILENNR
ncbi:MAG: hypothetical protein ACRC8A_12670 [Microcoleaceae cyanobacterium]